MTEIFILLGLIVLNGLFAMSEIALVTARRARLQKLKDDGDKSAAVALALGEDPNRFLSTIQIGITSIGILNGIVGEAALAAPFADWLETLGARQPWSDYAATALVVVVVTYVSILVGELVPKRLGQFSPEGIARFVARPMTFLSLASKPFVWLLSRSTELLLRLMGANREAGPSVTEEEIHAMLAEGSQSGVIEQSEHAMVRNGFRLDDRQISPLMVPRPDIVWLDLSDPIEDNLATVANTVHSRFPVCDGELNNVRGIIHTKQLLARSLTGKHHLVQVAAKLLEALFQPFEIADRSINTGTSIGVAVSGQHATTAEQLDWLDAGIKHHPAFAVSPVPTFAQALRLCSELGLWVNAEIKPTPGTDAATGRAVAAVAGVVSTHRVKNPAQNSPPAIVLSSFSTVALQAAMTASPALPRALLLGETPTDWRALLDSCGASALHVAVGVESSTLHDLCASGLPVACYTVNDRQTADILFAAGVSAIFTDRPDLWTAGEM